MFSYFESSVDGIIPNEYSSLESICCDLCAYVTCFKDACMLTARRFWVAQTQLSPKSLFRLTSLRDHNKINDDSSAKNLGLDTNASCIALNAANINNMNILNNLHNINHKLQNNEKFLLITNNEIHEELLKNMENFNNMDAMKTQYAKKDN